MKGRDKMEENHSLTIVLLLFYFILFVPSIAISQDVHWDHLDENNDIYRDAPMLPDVDYEIVWQGDNQEGTH